MKNHILLLYAVLFLSFIAGSCSKKNKEPEPDVAVITAGELTGYYLVMKSSNPAFALVLFDPDGANVKWSCHWLGGLRQGNTALKNIDNGSKTADLQIDLDAPGARSMIFKVVKNSSGDLSVQSGTGLGATGNITLVHLIKKSSLSGLVLNGSKFQSTQNNIYSYSFVPDEKFRLTQSGFVLWTKEYYPLGGNVGFKSNDDQHFGVFISDGGRFGFEMRSSDGTVVTAQKTP